MPIAIPAKDADVLYWAGSDPDLIRLAKTTGIWYAMGIKAWK